MTTLKSLDISWNEFGDSGMVALAPALKSMTSLETLDISFNSMGPEGIATLAPALLSLTKLTKVNIRGARPGLLGHTSMAIVQAQLPNLIVEEW